MYVRALRCSACEQTYEPGRVYNTCACGKPLLVDYDLDRIRGSFTPSILAARRPDLWRYREVLPVPENTSFVSLGEGMTPLLPAPRLGAALGLTKVYLKDESANPTGTFKARGMAVAVSMARALGLTDLAVPSAGNAGGALAAYAAQGGLQAHIFMPSDTPAANIIECQQMGADVHLVHGLIHDCAREVAAGVEQYGWFDVSTLKEPYRVEGKKTMGYELFEQLGGELPDVILYPTGGGTGLIGMWKAFDEMERLGWIDARRPRMVAVQAAGCAPLVQAMEQGLDQSPPLEKPHTVASGLRVPRALGDFLILRILRESGGTAVAVPDADILAAVGELARREGIFAAPEGAACVAALRVLVKRGWVQRDERVVLFITGTGYKYLHLMRAR